MVSCRYCKRYGHHISECSKIICEVCHKKGHTSQKCPLEYVPPRVGPDHCYRWGEEKAFCEICKKEGHYTGLCGKYLELEDREKFRIYEKIFISKLKNEF